MGHVFSHLSKTDRYKIEALLNQGHTKREIADELHVHISTIYREIKRARWQYLDVIHGLQKIAITRTGRKSDTAKTSPQKAHR